MDVSFNRGFTCNHCNAFVPITNAMGTAHRNHCNHCLWSKHVDETVSGDRKATCQAGMAPIAITLKHEGKDKYGYDRFGDIMIVHHCTGCQKNVINRIAADDPEDKIEDIFEDSVHLSSAIKSQLANENIIILQKEHKHLLLERLYGKGNF